MGRKMLKKRKEDVNIMSNEKEYSILTCFDELKEDKKNEFQKLADDYSMSLQLMNLFIEVNNLDYDEIWDKANQQYDTDMTYAPDEE